MALCGLSVASEAALAGALMGAFGIAVWLQRALGGFGSGTARQIVPLLAASGFGLAGSAALPWVLTSILSVVVGMFPVGSTLFSVCIYSIPALCLSGILGLVFAVSRVLDSSGDRGQRISLLPVIAALPAVLLSCLSGVHPVMLMAAFLGLAVVCVSLGAFPMEVPRLSGLPGTSAGRHQRHAGYRLRSCGWLADCRSGAILGTVVSPEYAAADSAGRSLRCGDAGAESVFNGQHQKQATDDGQLPAAVVVCVVAATVASSVSGDQRADISGCSAAMSAGSGCGRDLTRCCFTG
ncbi:MAG UNVERIFIED_CONTAM: hypothetical protein LVR18_52105 [Planctomycetaceae bacterium]